MKAIHTLLAAALLALPLCAAAHGEGQHGSHQPPAGKEQKAWGIAGDAKAVSRTIELSMTDDMRFTPDRVEVQQGETVRFSVKNAGKIMHEIVIGTKASLDEHAARMVKFPGMAHGEPYMAHVAPGKAGDLVWNFNRAGEFDFACLIAGHYQAGMVGRIKVVAATQGTARP